MAFKQTRPDPKHVTIADLHWLAGLLEGEGSFGIYRNTITSKYTGIKKTYLYPIIQLSMSDEDVVRRAVAMFGTWCLPHKDRRGDNRKIMWRTSVLGSRAASWMRILHPLMGKRRSGRISEVLAIWENRKWRKLNHLEIGSIFKAKGSQRKIAKRFGTSQSIVGRIKRRVTYQEETC